jgi:hypothetical protein
LLISFVSFSSNLLKVIFWTRCSHAYSYSVILTGFSFQKMRIAPVWLGSACLAIRGRPTHPVVARSSKRQIKKKIRLSWYNNPWPHVTQEVSRRSRLNLKKTGSAGKSAEALVSLKAEADEVFPERTWSLRSDIRRCHRKKGRMLHSRTIVCLYRIFANYSLSIREL